ncbi:hypothetical protein GCM10010289_75490 [Streptomyces violascens]|nr:hypothetical protein GCM10010289_75490 [Streptomyces violascens]
MPDGTVAGGIRLDAWLTCQRAARRANRLTDAQTAALDAIKIRWNR